MLDQIEEAVKNRIGDKLSDAAGRLDIQRGVDGIPRQAIYVSVEEGDFTRVTQETYSLSVKGYVDIVFSHLQNEEMRRKGIAPILEGVYQCLLLQKLGLAISPIVPQRFRNTTTEELRQKGLIVFSLEFGTKFNVARMDEETVTDLLRVGLNYYLQDPADDDEVDAADLVTLSSS
jgi:hypothetical protein